jgi:hypothetical protein
LISDCADDVVALVHAGAFYFFFLLRFFFA